MKKSNIIKAVTAVVITIAVIAILVITMIRAGQTDKPSPDTEIPETIEITDPPAIPDIPADPDHTAIDSPGEDNSIKDNIRADVGHPVDESRDDNPGIDGDVAIIPGVKGAVE